jgi:hypothetical protein
MAPQIAYPPATDTPAPAPAAAQPEMAVNPELLGRINQLLDS